LERPLLPRRCLLCSVASNCNSTPLMPQARSGAATRSPLPRSGDRMSTAPPRSGAVPQSGAAPRSGAARHYSPAAFRWQRLISLLRSTGKTKPHASQVLVLNRSKDTQAPDACSQRAAAAFGPGGPSFEPASLSAPTAGNASAGEKLSPNEFQPERCRSNKRSYLRRQTVKWSPIMN